MTNYQPGRVPAPPGSFPTAGPPPGTPSPRRLPAWAIVLICLGVAIFLTCCTVGTIAVTMNEPTGRLEMP